MKFIDPVLQGFLDRNFGRQEMDDPARFEPHMDKIRAFISDESPYWVKEKAIQVIFKIEEADFSIRTGEYAPISPADAIETILCYAKKRIVKFAALYRSESSPGLTHISSPLPQFPIQKFVVQPDR